MWVGVRCVWSVCSCMTMNILTSSALVAIGNKAVAIK